MTGRPPSSPALADVYSTTGVEIDPRDVFRILMKAGAAAVILCHNHPSGDSSPPRQTSSSTGACWSQRTLRDAVLDHVIVGFDGYARLSKRGWH
jgi:DNA repair protein RadC